MIEMGDGYESERAGTHARGPVPAPFLCDKWPVRNAPSPPSPNVHISSCMHVSRARFTAEAECDEERTLPSLKNASLEVVEAVSVGDLRTPRLHPRSTAGDGERDVGARPHDAPRCGQRGDQVSLLEEVFCTFGRVECSPR